jgi:cytosine/adenosine deaminase-related metal-dependent hydrolase
VPAIDLGAVALLPGFVNPHTHLELTCYAGAIPPGPFWPWIGRLIELRRGPDLARREADAVVDGAWKSLRAGVTCVGDISRQNLHWRRLKPIPIRKVCFAELLSVADHPPRNPEELRRAVAEIEEDDLLTAGITPHAPYSVPEGHIRAAAALASELGRPWTMHWLETREEAAFLCGQRGVFPPALEALVLGGGIDPHERRPADLLDRCTAGLGPGALAHVNYIDDEGIARLAASGHSVIYCPRAHAYFGHAPHPFERLRAAGVRVAFGTDSLASNESQSILDELRYVHRTLKPASISADDLLRMGTLDAAATLGLDESIGSLEPGKQADLVAIPLPDSSTDSPVGTLFETDAEPSGVWVAGRAVEQVPSLHRDE